MRHALSLIALLPSAALAQQITADRPGIGVDPEVVPQWTLQPEMGTDSKEIRLGVLPHLELDRDDTSWGAKVALTDARLKTSLKLSYDNALHPIAEVPANYTFSDRFNLGLDASWAKSQQTYAAEFNYTPTNRLTITPTLYHDGKTRAALFAAWIVQRHNNAQFDLGYDKHKVSVGISTALNFKDVLHPHIKS